MQDDYCPKTLLEAARYFADREVCEAYMRRIKWPDGKITCPECGASGERIGEIQTRRLFTCRECRRQFSATVGTIFEDARRLDAWLAAIWAIANGDQYGSLLLARACEIEQKAAWAILVRVRVAMGLAGMLPEYRILTDWPAYRVGDDGSVWSRWKIGARRGSGYGEWRLVRTPVGTHGYRHVNLHDGQGGSQGRTVASLVCEAFCGLRPEGMEVLHKNGDREDDRADNLRWGTHAENVDDQIQHGTVANGERSGRAKLTDEQVAEIRSLAGTMTHKAISERYGVGRRYIGALLAGDWRKRPTQRIP